MKKILHMLISLILIVFLNQQLLSKGNGNKNTKSTQFLKKVSKQRTNTFLDINKISTLLYNNGISDITPFGNSGLVYPKGGSKTAVFTSGLLWGAKVTGDPDPRVGGSAYRTGLIPGNVDNNGNIPSDNTIDKYRIYRVRRDVRPGGNYVDLRAEALNESTSETDLRLELEKDWLEWPADMGAPYEDKNNNGVYDPFSDIPGEPGADMTIWFVANDLDTGQTTFLYGAKSLGIEIQCTIWAYKRGGELDNIFFKKYKLTNVTNRGSLNPQTFNNMYLSYWMDVDLGDAGDDFIGVDTINGIQFSYNATNIDGVYTPDPPPTTGISFLNIPMTAAYYFANGTLNIGDPPQGVINGSRQFYNFFQGKYGISGQFFKDFETGQPTTFALNGDPIKNTGWVDGIELPPGDRRSGIASGPFNLVPGETKEVILAEIVAEGKDNINAIKLLKYYLSKAKDLYKNNFKMPEKSFAPQQPKVSISDKGNSIQLTWERYNNGLDIENYNQSGFEFEGYNIYQFVSPYSSKENGKLITTIDKINGVKYIYGSIMDTTTGLPKLGVAQFGTDSGIKYSYTVDKDYISSSSLYKGKEYNYGVSAYSYNTVPSSPLTNYESNITPAKIKYHEFLDGFDYGYEISLTSNYKTDGNNGPKVKVINPENLTGHKYEFYFKDQVYINDGTGWHKGNSSNIKDNKNKFAPFNIKDISPSTMSFIAKYSSSNTIDLKGTFNLVSPDFDFADGVKLDFSNGITINSAEGFTSAIRGDFIAGNIIGQSIFWGDSSRSTFGAFSGGEVLTMNISGSIPFYINYTIYDDGYGDLYAGTTNGVKDAYGTVTIDSVETNKITQHQWNLKDVNLGFDLLSDQTVFSGIDLYFGIGPGGSSDPALGGNLGSNYTQLVDGLSISMGKIQFDAPITYSSAYQTRYGGSTRLDFWGDATLFGFPNGLVTPPLYGGNNSGATEEDLSQDLELRFTGVPDSTATNPNESKIISGGSIATIYSRTNDSLASRVRIPFELWEVERNRQINLWIVSRNADGSAPWGNDGMPMYYRMYGRDYIIPYPTDYNENATVSEVGKTGNRSTWFLFFKQSGYSKWTTGDEFLIKYPNKFDINNTFTFNTGATQVHLSQPPNQSIQKNNVVKFVWYSSKSTNKYRLQITTIWPSQNIIYDNSNIEDTSAIVELPTVNSTNPWAYYAWRVIPITTDSMAIWSEYYGLNLSDANIDYNTISISNSKNSVANLFFGEKTFNVPEFYYHSLPPAPPIDVFDARLLVPITPSVESDIDLRDTSSTEIKIWTIKIQAGTEGYPLKLHWKLPNVVKGNYTLKDGITGYLIKVDMLLHNEYSIADSNINVIKIIYNPNSTLSANINIASGWNIVSIPIFANDMSKVTLFKDATSSAFTFASGYKVADTLTNGKGYWLKFPAVNSVPINGSYSSASTIYVNAGWNLIGGYDRPLVTKQMTSTPSGIISSSFFGYNNGYFLADTLIPGKGYWIKASQDGVLNITKALAKGQTNEIASAKTINQDWGRIIVRDASGKSNVLYMGKDITDIYSYELPPKPPTGVFDVRFTSSNSYVENMTGAKEIEINTDSYPVEISISNMKGIRIYDKATGGKLIDKTIGERGRITITNKATKNLVIEEKIIPTVFSLEQNYPNPFNPSTTIKYGLPENTRVRLTIYNTLGQKVEEIVNEEQEAGYHKIIWQASRYASGVYIYRIEAGRYSNAKKLILMK